MIFTFNIKTFWQPTKIASYFNIDRKKKHYLCFILFFNVKFIQKNMQDGLLLCVWMVCAQRVRYNIPKITLIQVIFEKLRKH